LFASGTFLPAEGTDNLSVSTARESFAEFLGYDGLLELDGNEYSLGAGGVWGPVDEVISDEVVRETIQELTDLCIFFDLFEIEYRRTGDSAQAILDRMRDITRSERECLLMPGEIPRRGVEELSPWLVAIRDFMLPWPGRKPLSFFSDDFHLLKKGVGYFYTFSVAQILRRQPTPLFQFDSTIGSGHFT
jgi:hypothetical protein